jgi:hypothetical protein
MPPEQLEHPPIEQLFMPQELQPQPQVDGLQQ